MKSINEIELFEGLNNLCETTEAFYHTEQELNENIIIRSYSYRLASYQEFSKPYALYCRGISYYYDKRTNEWKLFTRAFKKFFNLGEGIPKDEFVSKRTAVSSFEKLDGSLIMVGEIDNKLIAKSKTSINSYHAREAQALLDSNEDLTLFCRKEISKGKTPIFELVGPKKLRIVLSYDRKQLIYLGSIDEDYNYIFDGHNILNKGTRSAKVNKFNWKELQHIQETSKPDIEGFVVLTDDGTLVKCKVQSYVDLHHSKESITNIKNLVNLVIEDNLDDLIGLFQDDEDTLKYISEIQGIVSKEFNHSVVSFKELVSKYFNEFNQDSKEFSLEYSNKGKNPDRMFGYVMTAIKRDNINDDNLEDISENYVKQFFRNITKKSETTYQFFNIKE